MGKIQSACLMLTALFLGILHPATAAELTNNAFTIQYDDQGITSLRRTHDVRDTDYIAPGGVLGGLVIRYRAASQDDWLTLREMMLSGPPDQNNTLRYSLGTLLPTLAAQSTPSAQAGDAAIEALNDGLVPAPPATGRGRRGGARAGARGAGRGQRGGLGQVPTFTMQGSRGQTQWVQYAFPAPQQVTRASVYWAANPDVETAPIRLPESWRLLYLDGDAWRPVQASTPYGLEPNAFNVIEFAPVRTSALRVEVRIPQDATVSLGEWRVGPEREVAPARDLSVEQSFHLDGAVLDWSITLANQSDHPIEVGDLAIPLRMAEGTPGNRGDIYNQKLLRHSFIAGHGSWIYWARSGAVGPFLVLTTHGPTKFEFSDQSGGSMPGGERGGRGGGGGRGRGGFTPYIHATVANAGPMAEARQMGREQPWRLPRTGLDLAAKGSSGSEVTYAMRLQWAPDFQGVRDALYADNQIDTTIVPGMSLPSDLPAMIALRTKNRIQSVDAEFPDQTKIEFVGDRGDGNKVYKVQFSKLGENMLKVRYGDNQWMSLEFFVMEPMETVLKKRSKFVVKMQHMDDTKPWYGGYGDWDQLNKVLRNPEDRDGLSPWLTDSSDDAGNARPAYIAAKNVFFPDPNEIASVERYISRYLWNGATPQQGIGGMQMTEQEPYPYGIYGTFVNWWEHRASPDEPPATYNGTQQAWTRLHKEHLWRIYDYPHIMLMYFRMYQLAKYHPDLVRFTDADGYLMLAYRTSIAYWTVPMLTDKPRGWSANSVPTMNESFVPELIEALEEEGKQKEADTLRSYWETKVARFVLQTPNLYGSEFSFDSTGFESTGALAQYAVENAGVHRVDPPTTRYWTGQEPATFSDVTPAAAKEFLDFQMRLNMNDRGWLENTYYLLGTDYRGSTTYLQSYMSHLGGWAVLNHGLHIAADPTDYLRLGYASALSAWCLVNSGTAESGYGYWWPGIENDGATGGGFVPEVMGRGWIGKTMPRGAWYYSAEEDVGYVGALRSHATIVVSDPVFGDYAYGGILTRPNRRTLGVIPRRGDAVRVIPRDGLRARLYVIRGDQRVFLDLRNDGFASEKPVTVADDLGRIEFTLEDRTGRPHNTELMVGGLPAGDYAVNVGGRPVASIVGGSKAQQKAAIPLWVAPDAAGSTIDVSIVRR